MDNEQVTLTLNPQGSISVLVLAKPGGLRDGLTALISVVPCVAKIFHAANHPQALRRILQSQPVLVVLDGDLSPESGIDFLRLLKEQYSGALYLVLVGDASKEKWVMEAGADDVLIKGIQADQLLAAIENKLSGRCN